MSKVKGQGHTLETLESNISKMVYEIESIQIGRVIGTSCFQYLPKKNIQIKPKKPFGLKKIIYWLNGTKEDK